MRTTVFLILEFVLEFQHYSWHEIFVKINNYRVNNVHYLGFRENKMINFASVMSSFIVLEL